MDPDEVGDGDAGLGVDVAHRGRNAGVRCQVHTGVMPSGIFIAHDDLQEIGRFVDNDAVDEGVGVAAGYGGDALKGGNMEGGLEAAGDSGKLVFRNQGLWRRLWIHLAAPHREYSRYYPKNGPLDSLVFNTLACYSGTVEE